MSNCYGYWGPYNHPGYGYWGPNNYYGGWWNNANNNPIPIMSSGPGAGAQNVGGFSGSTKYGTAPGSVNLGLAGVGCNGGSITNKALVLERIILVPFLEVSTIPVDLSISSRNIQSYEGILLCLIIAAGGAT
ncbi:hypothetical protein SLE2022_253980 [Rubroshorea leprosula]